MGWWFFPFGVPPGEKIPWLKNIYHCWWWWQIWIAMRPSEASLQNVTNASKWNFLLHQKQVFLHNQEQKLRLFGSCFFSRLWSVFFGESFNDQSFNQSPWQILPPRATQRWLGGEIQPNIKKSFHRIKFATRTKVWYQWRHKICICWTLIILRYRKPKLAKEKIAYVDIKLRYIFVFIFWWFMLSLHSSVFAVGVLIKVLGAVFFFTVCLVHQFWQKKDRFSILEVL